MFLKKVARTIFLLFLRPSVASIKSRCLLPIYVRRNRREIRNTRQRVTTEKDRRGRKKIVEKNTRTLVCTDYSLFHSTFARC